MRTALAALLVCCAAHLATGQVRVPESATFSDGVLRFPAGIHQIDQPIVIEMEKVGSIHIVGDGRARLIMNGPGPVFRIIGTHDGTAAPSSVKPNVWQRENAPLIRDLEIVGKHPDCDGVELIGTMQPMIKNLTIRKVRHGIRLAKRNRNVIISDCQIYENRGAGIYYDHVNLHQSNIVGSHISYNAAGGVVIRGGDVRNVHISGCDIEGNMGDEKAPPTANVLLDAADGSIGEVAITGCTIQHTHEAKDSANIRMTLLSPERTFTNELRHGNVTISGNVLSDAQINVDIQHARGVSISGNTMWKGYHHNVRIRESASINLTGNVMDRNERYFYGDGSESRLGIVIEDSSHCTLSGNTLTGVGDIEAAIEISRSTQIAISGGTISGFPKHAIRLRDVTDCEITGCVIAKSASGVKSIVNLGETTSE